MQHFFIGLILDEGGFIKGSSVQTPQAVQTILLAFLLGTGVLVGLALLITFTFHLNRDTHKIIVDEINRLKAGGSKEDVTLETKAVVEDLTGYKYEDIWQPTEVTT
ncbi:hypothetical protein ERICIV_00983 [Paenibacillus larvae subsp. larvae]|uniref:Uncharacterized protein n=1 Tax=Paenibacillus larvae subsp. larvae TaxID=147375 RepID=A0A2L1TX25_9BACL|nr:hypothetical protein [Paenibacillus larvae]AVF25168.1 hypothetical protein ERICIII_00963 [Paenibacillus larvae subsp. larvae]AVF29944.1 hypothetical protein ERICIV_00983 [Paenibacillus larvae subsp. larvae]MCY7519631.1 hypothetical protein [Paenibacillus larvae]MCY9499084.1 hypothetical protein [Paenibacillus larvae]MCY9681465.1 hypothetical protein [Paenibacillus larvae]